MPAQPRLGAGARHAGHDGRITAEQARDTPEMPRGKPGYDRRNLQGEELGAGPASVLVVAQDVPELAVQRVQRDRDDVRRRMADLPHDLLAAAADALTP